MQIVFDSFRGRLSDNPLAIFKAIRSNRTLNHAYDIKMTWLAKAPPQPVAGCQYIEPQEINTLSVAERAALENADVIFTNIALPPFSLKEGARFVETWHGTPLKRIGLDNRVHTARLLATTNNNQWTHLVSPNAYTSERLIRAYNFKGHLLQVGYPRNDSFSRPPVSRAAANARKAIGLTPTQNVVLYAPTFRDDVVRADGAKLQEVSNHDAAAIAKAVGPDTVVLLRLHYYEANFPRDVSSLPANVVDVTKGFDMSTLILASDIGIFDYSSTQFDWAITGKPMISYLPDLARYRDELRGFYIDDYFENEVPGPVTTTVDDLTARLKTLDQWRPEYEARYATFQTKFCSLADGQASNRVLQGVFSELDLNLNNYLSKRDIRRSASGLPPV